MGYYGTSSTFLDLALAVIGVIFLVAVTESFAKILDDIIAWSPIKAPGLHALAVRMVLAAIASAICWQGHFGFFTHAGFDWRYSWENYLSTGLLVSGGSPVISKALRLGGLMPSVLGGMSSVFGWGSGNSTTELDTDPTGSIGQPESDQKGDL